MIKQVPDALTPKFLRSLLENTMRNLEEKDYACLNADDPNHIYCNFKFVKENQGVFTGLLSQHLQEIYPGCKNDDFVYLNDFIVGRNIEGVNLETGFGLHRDGTDRWVGPCFNIWMPFFDPNIGYDGEPLLEFFEENEEEKIPGRLFYDWDYCEKHPEVGNLFKAMNRPPLEKDQLCFWNTSSFKFDSCSNKILNNPLKVTQSKNGNILIFASDILHRSGLSKTPRVAIGVKFLYKPDLTIYAKPQDLPPCSSYWTNVFLATFLSTNDISSFEKTIPDCISMGKVNREKQNHIESLIGFLKKVYEQIR